MPSATIVTWPVFESNNRTKLYSVDTGMTDSSFGKATNQLPPRSMQLHLRATF
jgi:hypothetical protein